MSQVTQSGFEPNNQSTPKHTNKARPYKLASLQAQGSKAINPMLPSLGRISMFLTHPILFPLSAFIIIIITTIMIIALLSHVPVPEESKSRCRLLSPPSYHPSPSNPHPLIHRLLLQVPLLPSSFSPSRLHLAWSLSPAGALNPT
jgi:hypothetical protein